jgi:hypothetical protein
MSAEAGNWDEAEKMRVPIKEREGVRKPPGLAGST